MASVYFIDEKHFTRLTEVINNLNRYSKQALVEFGVDADVSKLCDIHRELLANKISEEAMCEYISSY